MLKFLNVYSQKKEMEKYIMSFFEFLTKAFTILGTPTAIVSLIISICNYNYNKIEASSRYFAQARDPFFMEGKNLIYHLKEDDIIDENKSTYISTKITCVMNYYHYWGMMVKNKQLPFSVFYDKKNGITASGFAVIRTYNRLKPTITYFRNKNPKYAEFYEWLYNEIIKHCPENKDYR